MEGINGVRKNKYREYVMREIEIKAKVNQLEPVIDLLLEKSWVLSEEIRQLDTIYLLKPLEFTDIKPGVAVTRVRVQEPGSSTLNIKLHQTGELDCIEYETEISDPKSTVNILTSLGLNEVICVDKHRIKAKFNGHIICLDKVKELGTFIEIEALVPDDSNPVKVKSSLWNIMKSLGVSKEDEVVNGYDTLLFKKENNG